MKQRWLGIVIGAAGLALMAGGTVQAADLGYSFKSLAALDTTVAGVTIHGDFELGAVNASGAVVFVTELDNGEGGLMIAPDGKQTLLSMNGADASYDGAELRRFHPRVDRVSPGPPGPKTAERSRSCAA